MRKPIDFIKKHFSTLMSTKGKTELKGFILFVVAYGLMLNFVAMVLFNAIFSWYSFLAYGFAWYFTKYELTKLYHQFRGFK